MSTAKISSPVWTGSNWSVYACVDIDEGTRCGAHVVDLPEEATEDELAAAVLVLYELPAPPTKKKK